MISNHYFQHNPAKGDGLSRKVIFVRALTLLGPVEPVCCISRTRAVRQD
jgi:hypothetical protein